MAETPASPRPESSTGVPATPPAVSSEPTVSAAPATGSEPASPYEPAVSPAPTAGPCEPAVSAAPSPGSEPASRSAPATAALPTSPSEAAASLLEPAVAPTPAPQLEEGMTPAATGAAPSAATGTAVAPAPSPLLEVSPPPQAPDPPLAVEALAALDPGEPRVATTLDVPPLPAAAAGSALGSEGGEFELLVGKVTAWLERADLPGQWERLGGPLRGLGVLLGVLLVLKLYVALLDTLDDLLLLPRLLQLVGLIALLRFSVNRLTRSGDRQKVWDDWKRRWDAFRGS